MKKYIAFLAFVSLLLTGYIYAGLIPFVLADHTSTVMWDENACSLDPFVLGPDEFNETADHLMSHRYVGDLMNKQWVMFNVTNNMDSMDDIDKVQVFLDQNETHPSVGYVYFHFVEGEVTDEDGIPVQGWTTTILEVDPRGWPRVIIFEAKGEAQAIIPDDTYHFNLTLAEGPEECSYEFIITTIDTSAYSQHDILVFTLDNTEPYVDVEPRQGDIVKGIISECGNNYFWLNITAYDVEPHDTGICDVSIRIDNDPWPCPDSVDVGPGQTWTLPVEHSKVENLASGEHNITVTAWDCVGNSKEVSNDFTYDVPDKPFRIVTPSDKRGSAALETTIKDSDTGLVESKHYPESEHYLYDEKEFGTFVEVEGNSFGANLDVKVTVYIETYGWYYKTYGTYDVLVAIAKTGSDGKFTANFNFSKAPAGKYRVSARSTEMFCYDDFEVLPQIIFDPNEVIGPALINVEATGFMSVPLYEWPETWTIYVLCNNKDTLQGVNEQVYRNWYIDGNGTLQNEITYITGHFTENGLYWPALQPGTYEVTLFVATTGSYWNIDDWEPRTSFKHGNTITVVSTLDLLPKIYDKIVEIDGDVVKILTEVGLIEIKLDDLKPVVERIDKNVAYIRTTVDTIQGTVTSIDGNTTYIKTEVGDIAVNTSKIIDKLKPTPADLTLTVNIATILSAIAAIAAIIAAAVVTKRLKVAA